jgi:type IX secretion system substrate protein
MPLKVYLYDKNDELEDSATTKYTCKPSDNKVLMNILQLNLKHNDIVKVKEFGSQAFGFESTVLDSNTNKIGNFAIINPVTTAYQTLLGREYLSHNNTGSNLSNDSLTWQFNWTAPASNVGSVIIYAAGVAHSNLAPGPFGNVYKDSLIINPDSSIITDFNEVSTHSNQINIFPNPVKDILNINFNQKIKTITIIDISGKVVRTVTSKTKTIVIADLQKGIYFIRIRTTRDWFIQKFIKK